MSTRATKADQAPGRDGDRVIDPEPLDPEPLAIGSDDLEDFVEHYGDEERAIDTDVQPPQ